ncbi:3'(2'),5'-bisphosphate nucleotidase CysQ [Rhizobium sp. CC-YZS058]|uniref:3'(2'),5'-bisphosphate nucleotidase CysQ n=1 Tax=Rhizobium sp. CC-YZS058 TaxID=3042153 RepID=UPI003A4C52FF
MMTASALPDTQWLRDLELITTAAMAAGEKALGFFRKNPDFRYKNEDRSPVSEADYAANDVLKERLLAARPNYGWLSEETDDDEARLGCETVFVVDPIDGTRAFIAGKDVWCVSVAVVHEGRPVAGVLYAPALIELYQAAQGQGARRNGLPIRTSQAGDGDKLQIALSEQRVARLPAAFRAGMTRIAHVPSLAYRLAMIADGRIDGTVVERNSHDWDLAAADLILDEAGGRLAGLDGQPLAYNGKQVTHDLLCAARLSVLDPLVAAAGGSGPH